MDADGGQLERTDTWWWEPGDGGEGDPYAAATAEFYDLLATAHWDVFGPQLVGLLAGTDPSAGPIIDVGAGTGVGLSYLVAAVPDARIVAIEPSMAMRTALHIRLALSDALRSMTTVDPRPFAKADLPEQVSAVVVSAALGHLTDHERQRLWQLVVERLPVGAPAVVEVLPPTRPIVVPPTRYRSLTVGDFVYEGWQEGEPVDDHTMRWTMTYRVLAEPETIAEYRVVSAWRCLAVDDIRAEVTPLGLDLEDLGEVVVLRRPR